MLRLVLGLRAGWTPQNRADRGVSWAEAARMLWPHTLIGVLTFWGYTMGGWLVLLFAIPLTGGLLLAIPLCVFSADPRIGGWLRDHDIAAIPEEIAASNI